MKLVLAILAALWACGEPSPTATPIAFFTPPDPSVPSVPAHRVRSLVETARWARLAVPIAFGHDGRQWIGGVAHDLVVHDGEREVQRVPVMTGKGELRIGPGGGWIAGGVLVAADGTVRWSGHEWAQRFGRFGAVKAAAFSPDGKVAILAGSDSPSRCSRDRACGRSGGDDGGVARFTFGDDPTAPPVERRLVDHTERRDYAVAASARWLAALEGHDLTVWPATGNGAPVTATVEGSSLTDLTWADDRYLIVTRYVDVEHSAIVVLDRTTGYAPRASWQVDGSIQDLAIRPGGAELAVALTRYRARTSVEIDERRVAVFGLDGKLGAQVDVPGYPAAVAWSPRGDTLLVASTGSAPAEQMILRYDAR